MKVYFITRFSIFDPNYRFKTNSGGTMDPEVYRSILYCPERMSVKLFAFFNITLPSILAQLNKNWEWHIYIGEQMPLAYKDKLKSIKDPRIKIIEVSDRSSFDQSVAEYTYAPSYATVRLDDDDGLHKSYVNVLQKYRNNHGCVISFPLGRTMGLIKHNIIMGAACNHEMIALGLAGVQMDIYSTGDHMNIINKYPVIRNNTPNMYYYFQNAWTDSKMKWGKKIHSKELQNQHKD